MFAGFFVIFMFCIVVNLLITFGNSNRLLQGPGKCPDPYLNEKNEQEKNGKNDPVLLISLLYCYL
ncbi:hypothetical protein DLD82_15180 [Methanospirillum stamsii]|uniref:Uncharacterized protein n=1 Tax=Methanospirillum stamsii TaxID=1277351 RepID=A0A2V2N2S9_9EURY|nr:hypothetical protein DLD82_15180 [Methanospirillum stamsii]